MIRIVVADDHSVVRIGLEQLLATFADLEVVGSASGGDEAIALCRAVRPDVLLLDLSMPGRDGAEVAELLSAEQPETRIIIFTSFSERAGILRALDAGAIGFLFKDAEPSELHAAILAASRGEAPLAPKAAMALLTRHGRAAARDVELTGREREVLGLVLAGLANKQIARRLGISEKTVKGHLTNLFQRIGVTDRTQAALWAERTGALRERGTRD